MAIRAVPAFLALGLVAAQQQQQPQKIQAPSWLSDDGKDVFNDIESDEQVYSDLACENREKLLKWMAGKGDQGAGEYRARTLQGMGMCEMRKGNYAMAKKRLDNSISEMNVPSEDMMLQNPQLAPIALMKQAAGFLEHFEVTQAGTQLRRCREILDRNMKKILKMVHKQMSDQQKDAPPLENIVAELPGLGKSGQFMPSIVKQVPMLKEQFAFAELVENTLDLVDRKLAAADPSQKSKRLRLEQSKSQQAKTGSLLYARALFTRPVVPAEHLAAAKELVDGGAAKAFMKEAAAVDKPVTLIKRTKSGSGCREGGGLDATCKALLKIADIQSNGFGETRLLLVKDKKQVMEVCTTNANLAILMAAKDGATLTIAGVKEPVVLKAGEPVVYDFCLEASLESSSGKVPVLVAQAWHPEFAAVERTTELRSRSSSFGLSEDEVKAVVKVVNDNAKKSWEKTAKQWRSNNEGLEAVKSLLKSEVEAKLEAKSAAESLKAGLEDNDEEKQKALQELEKKREEKRVRAEVIEAKRQARAKQLEEEKANRDPWLNFPEVEAVVEKLADLKDQRRDANAKLEFDTSTQLTKDISAAERALKKAIKVAKKAYKKDPTAAAAASKKEPSKEEPSKETPASPEGETPSEEKKKVEAPPEAMVVSLGKRLEDLKRMMKEAADAEDFAEAKKHKADLQHMTGVYTALLKQKGEAAEQAESEKSE
eukprot:CAMPEP_0115111094 /NCGR_PEP_ID=MMETSP0227-20121206/39809_1 /TAXON_ID=89957 /ORGANISM="Polarella glacialis, Strain CCMP 1383" /LENGTH=709 /DNA_ID=CAMNT_0002510343 /DNA_START=67 /DNA_END=2196 /DNA_ORIENTATION=-